MEGVRTLALEVESPAEIRRHAAVRAWQKVTHGESPALVQMLKQNGKAAVYRLIWGENVPAVIAKWRRTESARIEQVMYEQVLPELDVSALSCYGGLDVAGGRWIFTEDAGGDAYDPSSDEHVASAARWLASLHVRGMTTERGLLTDRGPEEYRRHLRLAVEAIEASTGNPVLGPDDRAQLVYVIDVCKHLDADWPRIERAAMEGPSTLVHGDFTAKNLRIRSGGLITFDWETVGWGPAGIDLAHFANNGRRDALRQYYESALELWAPETFDAVERAAMLGSLFRSILSLSWICGHLKTPKAQKYVKYVVKFGTEIRQRSREALEGEMQIIRSRFPDGDTLIRGMGAMLDVAPKDVRITHREPNLFRSSFPSELVFCEAGERRLKLLCKYGVGHKESGFGHRGGVAYETLVYKQVLQPLPISRPNFHGEWTDPDRGEPWLAIEYIENALRTDAAEPDPDPLTIVGHWLGQFHRLCSERLENDDLAFLKRYDEAYYTSWAARTSQFAGHWHERLSWLRPLCDRFSMCGEVLLSAEPTVIHAEFTPHNVLVRKGVVYPVDWEAAAVGAGEIDIASLTDKWPERMVEACKRAYIAARWRNRRPPDFERLLTASRLYWALRWLGNKPEWTQREKSAQRFEQVRILGETLGMI